MFRVSAIDQAIERATNELLLGPDWGANLDICDMISADQRGCVVLVWVGEWE